MMVVLVREQKRKKGQGEGKEEGIMNSALNLLHLRISRKRYPVGG
jgi:hypothetical protein